MDISKLSDDFLEGERKLRDIFASNIQHDYDTSIKTKISYILGFKDVLFVDREDHKFRYRILYYDNANVYYLSESEIEFIDLRGKSVEELYDAEIEYIRKQVYKGE